MKFRKVRIKMRKLLVIVLFVVLFAGVASAQEVRQSGLEYIRKVVASADSSTLGATDSDWGQRKTNSHGIDIPSKTEAVLISVIGNHATDPDDGTVSIKFLIYRSGGPAITVGTYEFTFGDLRCNLKPRSSTQTAAKSKWAESATETSENWISTPSIVGSGTDTCVMLRIPTYGGAYIAAEVTAITAAHTVDILMSALAVSAPVVVSSSVGLTDTQLRASAVSVTESAPLTGFATSAKQLASDHLVSMSGPTKTSAVSGGDAWQVVTAATTTVGVDIDFSDAYGDSILYIEAAQIEAVAHAGGSGIKVQVSVDGRSWIDYTESTDLNLTADTAATTTLNGAVTAEDATIVLTDATTGDFDVQGRCWFIKDGTIANSESLFTTSFSTHTITMFDAAQNSHDTAVAAYDRVDQFAVNVREGITKARVVYTNTDADCDIAVRSWTNKVTAK